MHISAVVDETLHVRQIPLLSRLPQLVSTHDEEELRQMRAIQSHQNEGDGRVVFRRFFFLYGRDKRANTAKGRE